MTAKIEAHFWIAINKLLAKNALYGTQGTERTGVPRRLRRSFTGHTFQTVGAAPSHGISRSTLMCMSTHGYRLTFLNFREVYCRSLLLWTPLTPGS